MQCAAWRVYNERHSRSSECDELLSNAMDAALSIIRPDLIEVNNILYRITKGWTEDSNSLCVCSSLLSDQVSFKTETNQTPNISNHRVQTTTKSRISEPSSVSEHETRWSQPSHWLTAGFSWSSRSLVSTRRVSTSQKLCGDKVFLFFFSKEPVPQDSASPHKHGQDLTTEHKHTKYSQPLSTTWLKYIA